MKFETADTLLAAEHALSAEKHEEISGEDEQTQESLQDHEPIAAEHEEITKKHKTDRKSVTRVTN